MRHEHESVFGVSVAGDVNCKDTSWSFQVQPEGKLVGLGNSYFRLKAELKPVAK